MLKRSFVLVLLLFFITSCGQKITDENFLIGGEWVGTAGYEDGEAKGEPNCYPFEDDITFKNDDTVYNVSTDRDFEYWFNEDEGGYILHFDDSKTGN